jgi:hypothetical protein
MISFFTVGNKPTRVFLHAERGIFYKRESGDVYISKVKSASLHAQCDRWYAARDSKKYYVPKAEKVILKKSHKEPHSLQRDDSSSDEEKVDIKPVINPKVVPVINAKVVKDYNYIMTGDEDTTIDTNFEELALKGTPDAAFKRF